MQQQIDITKTLPIVCGDCGCPTFRPVVFLRRVSRLVSPDGQDHIIPLESMECSKCGHINEEFNPSPIVKPPSL
jgi:hypothetical protein